MTASSGGRSQERGGGAARIEQQPALDGVRALAVGAVLLFHAGFGWIGGGYLGVSVFFTLSGYLITSLLIAEYGATGRVDVGRFYTRRAKRLLPASLLWIAVVSILAALGVFSGVPSLRRDLWGALLQVFNWVKLASGESYADLNAAAAGVRRPLDHFWSLSVEQQFYWFWPLAFIGLVRLSRATGRRPRGPAAGSAPFGVPTAGVAVVAALSCAAAPVIAMVWGPDAAYWATPARLAEILVGALVACLLATRVVPAAWWWLAPVGAVLLGAACVLFPDGSGPAYEGWLPVVAVVSAATIVGLQPDAWPRRLLSARPLVAIGRLSYGIYIIHWPVYVVIDRQVWGLPAVVDLAVKWAITGALAVLSYRLVEVPARSSTWLAPRRALLAGVAATAVTAALVLVVPEVGTYYDIDPAAATEAGIDPSESFAPLITAPPPPATVAGDTAASTTEPSVVTTELVVPRPVRILVVGDSTATAIGAGLVNWAAANPDLAQVTVEAGSGCGLLVVGVIRLFGEDIDTAAECSPYVGQVVPDAVRTLRPDVVAVIETAWDVGNRQLEEGGPVLSPLDAEVAALLAAAYDDFVADMLALGVPRVAWMVPPMPLAPEFATDPMPDRVERYAVQREAMERTQLLGGGVRLVDLRAWMEQSGLADGFEARPDGTHFTTDAATLAAEEFLGEALVRVAIS